MEARRLLSGGSEARAPRAVKHRFGPERRLPAGLLPLRSTVERGLRCGAPARTAAAAVLILALAGATHAAIRIWSYDPANAETQKVAGRLTFEFRQRFMFQTILRVLATDAQATAELKPESERQLGAGGLRPLIGPRASERDLYEIDAKQDQGEAMISALCPGARRGFLAFGRLRPFADMRVYALGEDAGGAPRLCRTLDFNFHGDWRAPPTGHIDERELERSRGPG